MKVTVIGLGLIGGSLALDLKSVGFASEVTGVDLNEEHRRLAIQRGLVEVARPLDDLEDVIRKTQMVILAIPVSAIAEILPRIMDGISNEATVTDMGSTKNEIATLIRGHSKRAQFVASHPMAGTEHSGPRAAMSGLFTGRTAVICDRESSAMPHLEKVESMYRALQMRLVYMTSPDHDLHVAYVSHLSHISSFVLANTVLDIERNEKAIFDLAGGGFESTVRLAKSSPEMWTPIFEQNREHVLEAMGRYIDHLEKFRQTLLRRDREGVATLMKSANGIRRVLSMLHPSHDIHSNPVPGQDGEDV